MIAYPSAYVALLLLGQGAEAAATPKQKIEFMRAMKAGTKKAKRSRRLIESHKEFKEALYGNSERSSALRKKFMEKSTVVASPGERRMQNYNSYNDDKYMANYNYQSQSQQNQDNNAGGNRYSHGYNTNAYRNGNGSDVKDADDWFATYGTWENEFGFDVTQYSLSYHRCAAIRQYDDEIAAQEDTTSVFATKHFAVFRFCPEATCMGEVIDPLEEEYEREQQEYYYQGYTANQQDEAQDEDSAQGRYQDNCLSFNEEGECEEMRLFGARGDGCQENYGEYMIELEEYLKLMLEFQQERFETYCDFCEECMWEVYQAWLNKGGDRKLSYEEFKNAEEHQSRELGGNVDGGNAQNYFYKACPVYDTCSEYKNTCNQGVDDHLTEYFECTEVESANGRVAYAGPHCSQDGFTVTIGLYADQYCNEYIGNGANIAKFISEEIDLEEDAIKPWYNSMNGALDILKYSNEDDVCIPCRKGDMPYEGTEYEAQNDDQQEAQMNYGEEEINEICENLYMVSARCNKNFRSYNTKSKQAKYAAAVSQDDLTCDFIDSVAMGNYDEMGLLNVTDNYLVESNPDWLKDNIYAQEYGRYAAQVTPLQVVGLLVSLVACLALAAWSFSLRESALKTGPWRPRHGFGGRSAATNTAHAGDMDRQNSGIVVGRSQSNVSYYMT